MIAFLIIILLLFPATSFAEQIQFFGDILLSRGIDEMVKKEGKEPLVNAINPFLKKGTINIVNLEGAVGDKFSCVNGHNPCFNIAPAAIDILSGFNVVGLANNHSLDLGVSGLKTTIKELKKRGIMPLVGKAYSTIIETENGNVGIIAVTDIVNSSQDREHILKPDSPEIFAEIKRLKAKATFVAIYIHWGKELDNLPTKRMKELAQVFIKAGADMIVGHHPHVTGKVECMEGRPIVYSLGNFVFDQKYEDTKKGAVLRCKLDKDNALSCRLYETRTLMNSFIPQLLDGDASYPDKNKTLASCKSEMTPTWSGIFLNDKKEKRLTLKRNSNINPNSYMELHDIKTNQLLWKSPNMPIERIQPVDLNNDGIMEIMVIQKIYSSLDNEVGKRVYLYNIDKGLNALWRGSALSRPLLDAVFVKNQNNKKLLLIALHTTDSFLLRNPAKEGRIIMSYKWNGFGFNGSKEIKTNALANRLSFSNGKIKLIDESGVVVKEFSDKDFY